MSSAQLVHGHTSILCYKSINGHSSLDYMLIEGKGEGLVLPVFVLNFSKLCNVDINTITHHYKWKCEGNLKSFANFMS